MLGYVYIALSVLLGSVLCRLVWKNLNGITDSLRLPRFLVALPAWYLTGTLCMTWLVYLIACLFGKTQKPLMYANLIVMTAVFAVVFFYYLFRIRRAQEWYNSEKIAGFFDGRTEEKKGSYLPLYFVLIAFVFVTYLMYLTFYQEDGNTYVGYSVFSDFAPHLGMIRSFSVSNNFPTQYAHFAGEDIRYHFMFQFMVGNLEYLGMALDNAFNLPSIFGMVAVYMLLFVLVVRITKSRLCGYITTFLFTFRSSFTVFKYMAEQSKGNVLKALKENTEFLGYTQNENWGLWNLNVYCNQRHLAFALAVLLLAIIVFYPYMERMGKKLLAVPVKEDKVVYRLDQLKVLFLSKGAFGIRDIRMAVGMGLILGSLAFWNGSALIATLGMLFFMAAVSDERLDYLVTALIALGLSLLQSHLFVDGAAVSPAYYFGFLAENKTFWGVGIYLLELTGIVLFVAAAGACLTKGVKRYMLLVFSVPMVLAFTLSLTVDITVNHKWIMMSLMLLSMFAAIVITRFLKAKDWMKRVIAVILLFVLTATGMYDFTIVKKRNENYLIFSDEDPVTTWVMENATCEDIFLTPYYSLNDIVMGGAMLYYGWPYYAWSAGYDTDTRNYEVKQMYQARDSESLKELIELHNIRYIVVDHDCRTSSEYIVREDVIEETYEAVFEHDTGEWMVRIFDTEKEK